MKKNKRNTNISGFPLRSHGNKSGKTFKRAEITPDIQCSIFKITRHARYNRSNWIQKMKWLHLFKIILEVLHSKYMHFNILWVWQESLWIQLFHVLNIDEKITGSNFKWFLPIVYLGQVYLKIDKVWRDSWMTAKYREFTSLYIFAVTLYLSIKTQIKYHFLYEPSPITSIFFAYLHHW